MTGLVISPVQMCRKSYCTTPGGGIGSGGGFGIRKMVEFYIKNFYVMGKLLLGKLSCTQTGPEVIKHFSCSTQLSMKFFLLINVKMPTIVGILTLMSGKNSILGLSEPKKKRNFLIFLYL